MAKDESMYDPMVNVNEPVSEIVSAILVPGSTVIPSIDTVALSENWH